jgi:protein-tyrosine phosphatase
MVCLGNICRSPMAEVVLRAKLQQAPLNDVEVVSAGTGDWHVGKPMDTRAAATLTARGYDATRHRAQQVPAAWLEDCDVVLAMDAENRTDLAALSDSDASGRLRLFRDFDPEAPGADVPDPYFGESDGFADVLAMVERTCDRIVEELERLQSLQGPA